jgi:hypothetical protein
LINEINAENGERRQPNLANHPLATAPFRWNHQASVETMKRNKLRLSCVIFSPGAQELNM